jgi:hypothetical protein
MKNCSYCGEELTEPKYVYLGYHQKCFQKYAMRGAKPEDLGECIYCREALTTPKEKSSGYHLECSQKAANGHVFEKQVITAKQYRDLLEKVHLEPSESLTLQTASVLADLTTSSKKLAKEAAIGSVVKSKQAVEGIKDIFKIANARLGKNLDITNEEEAYAWAASEIENDEMVKGIWAMAFADAEGDEKKQKALYVKYRATKLLDELHRKNLSD